MIFAPACTKRRIVQIYKADFQVNISLHTLIFVAQVTRVSPFSITEAQAKEQTKEITKKSVFFNEIGVQIIVNRSKDASTLTT